MKNNKKTIQMNGNRNQNGISNKTNDENLNDKMKRIQKYSAVIFPRQRTPTRFLICAKVITASAVIICNNKFNRLTVGGRDL